MSNYITEADFEKAIYIAWVCQGNSHCCMDEHTTSDNYLRRLSRTLATYVSRTSPSGAYGKATKAAVVLP